MSGPIGHLTLAAAAWAARTLDDRPGTSRCRSADGAVMTDWEQFGAIVLIAFGVAIAVFVVLGVAQWLLWLLS